MAEVTTHEHDLRARWSDTEQCYRAVCQTCEHDAGRIDVTGWECIYGVWKPRGVVKPDDGRDSG